MVVVIKNMCSYLCHFKWVFEENHFQRRELSTQLY